MLNEKIDPWRGLSGEIAEAPIGGEVSRNCIRPNLFLKLEDLVGLKMGGRRYLKKFRFRRWLLGEKKNDCGAVALD